MRWRRWWSDPRRFYAVIQYRAKVWPEQDLGNKLSSKVWMWDIHPLHANDFGPVPSTNNKSDNLFKCHQLVFHKPATNHILSGCELYSCSKPQPPGRPALLKPYRRLLKSVWDADITAYTSQNLKTFSAYKRDIKSNQAYQEWKRVA